LAPFNRKDAVPVYGIEARVCNLDSVPYRRSLADDGYMHTIDDVNMLAQNTLARRFGHRPFPDEPTAIDPGACVVGWYAFPGEGNAKPGSFGFNLDAASSITTGVWWAAFQPVESSSSATFSFYVPGENISCRMTGAGRNGGVVCARGRPPTLVRLNSVDYATSGKGTGNVDQKVPLLDYGQAHTVGRYRCDSEIHGLTCVVVKTRKGFTLSSSGFEPLDGNDG
jgi:hypothetical protein